nr:hypothetical protein [uncultured Allomuricauda sp.]
MNFGLAREIYGIQPWFVDQETLPSLMSIMNSIRTGVVMELPEVKYNSQFILPISKDKRVIDRPFSDGCTPGQLDTKEDFIGVGVVNIDGPITTNGGASSYGMRHVSAVMQKMATDERIVSFIVFTDSGGGASGAVEIMADTINEIKKIKPVFGLIKKGGIAASAAYGILSACNEIYAESNMSIVGSAGTMVQFEGKAANSQDRDGFKYIRLYAPASTEKNKGYEEALNNDNYKVLVDELLKPLNDSFIKMIVKNRPMLKGTSFDDGHTVFAKEGIGTFIDGIRSFSQLFTKASNIKQLQKLTTSGSNSNINQNSKTMTAEELKQNHPETYKSIFNTGVSAEKDRVGSWLAHHSTNQETVLVGINSGKPISQTESQQLLVEAASKQGLKNLETDSAPPVNTTESPLAKSSEDPENKDEVKNFYSQVDSKLKTV